MTADQLEIENSRYLPAAFFVLPLTSGRIAVLTPRRDLFRIVDTWEEAKQIGPLAGAVNGPGIEITGPAGNKMSGNTIKINLAALGVKL